MPVLPVKLSTAAIKARREHLELSVGEVAERSGVDASLLRNVEAGRRGLSVRALVLVGRVLDLAVEDMVEVGDERVAP